MKIYDTATGISLPDPPTVGSNVALSLDVIFNEGASVQGIFVNVDFTAQGGSTPVHLYSQNTPAKSPSSYGPSEEFKDQVSWLIPSFAPHGHYAVTITIHGTHKDQEKFACLTADFDIYA
jgi:hypothetical protein